MNLRTKEGIRAAVPVLAHQIVHGSLTYGESYDLLCQAWVRHVWNGADPGLLKRFERRLSLALIAACDAAETVSADIEDHEEQWAPMVSADHDELVTDPAL